MGNNESSGKQVNESKHSMPMMLYFAVCHFLTPDIVFWALPRMPPKGFITSTLVKFIIIEIFEIITTQSCYHMWKQLCVAEIQGLVRRFTDRPIQDSQEITQNIIGRMRLIKSIMSLTAHGIWGCVVSFNPRYLFCRVFSLVSGGRISFLDKL
jgi:hypothetical protein